MGYYIETDSAKNKAAWLVRTCDAQVITEGIAREYMRMGLGIICVVDNGMFEAAGYMYNERELNEFANPSDWRPKTWLSMNKELAERLSGFRRPGERE